MTTIGHTMTGLSLAVLTVPRGVSLRQAALIGGAYAFFANLPDFPFPGWGHDAYHVSHSIFLALAAALLFGWLIQFLDPAVQIARRLLFGCTAAWLSHMLLDSTYSHGNGLAVFWPFSDAHLVLPLGWFDTLSLPAISEANRRVFLVEIAVFGSILTAAAVARIGFNRLCKK